MFSRRRFLAALLVAPFTAEALFAAREKVASITAVLYRPGQPPRLLRGDESVELGPGPWIVDLVGDCSNIGFCLARDDEFHRKPQPAEQAIVEKHLDRLVIQNARSASAHSQ